MINVSSAMGGQFAWSAAELTEEIRRMGPNPLRNPYLEMPEASAEANPISAQAAFSSSSADSEA